MINDRSSVAFPFGDRKALVSIDLNFSGHTTVFYCLANTKPCHVVVNAAFNKNNPGVGRLSGNMLLVDLFFFINTILF